MPEQLDLNRLIEQGAVTITARESEADAQHRRRKDTAVTIITLAILGTAFAISVYFVCAGVESQQKWAQGVLTTVVGAAIGYAIKK